VNAAAELPPGAKCAVHPDFDAQWMCNRCGSFICQGCERRVRPDATPMCPNCWALRAQVVKPQSTFWFGGTGWDNASVIFAIMSFLSMGIFSPIGVVISIIALTRPDTTRTRPIIGLVICSLFTLGLIAVAIGAAASS
jgi:hypothetical protein